MFSKVNVFKKLVINGNIFSEKPVTIKKYCIPEKAVSI